MAVQLIWSTCILLDSFFLSYEKQILVALTRSHVLNLPFRHIFINHFYYLRPFTKYIRMEGKRFLLLISTLIQFKIGYNGDMGGGVILADLVRTYYMNGPFFKLKMSIFHSSTK